MGRAKIVSSVENYWANPDQFHEMLSKVSEFWEGMRKFYDEYHDKIIPLDYVVRNG